MPKKNFKYQQQHFNDYETSSTEHYVYLEELNIIDGEIDDTKILDIYSFGTREDTATDLEYEIQNWLNKNYNRRVGFYHPLYLGEDINDDGKYLEIRIKNHSQNPSNVGKYSLADAYLSIVIANKNETIHRWHSSNELTFSGDDDLDEVKSQIRQAIQDYIYKLEIVKLSYELEKDDFNCIIN